MTKDKDIKTIVPALRFPEFRDGEGWKSTKLGNIGTPSMCKRILKEQTTAIKTNNIPFYKIGTFGSTADAYIPTELYEDYKSKYSYPNKGDILISASGTIGRLVVYDGEHAYFQDSNIVWINNNETKVLNHFLYYVYQILKWQTSDGGVISRLYNTDLNNINVKFPKDNKEQQKIANCLGSLDDLISAVADKIETLEEYKKGLMQQLFPAEGKTTPAIRFPEFQNAGEWKQIKLGDVGDPLMCKRILKEQTTNDAVGNIPFYKIGTFGGNPDAYISKDILEDYKRKYSYPNKGDILISAAGTIGRLVVFDGKPAYFQDSNIVWIGNSEIKVLNTFLYCVYQTLKWQTSDGGIVSRLYNNNLKNMTIIYPENKIEQQKIADCLSSVDELISDETAKLDQLKTHKKGLMQQLFPKLQ